MFSLVFLMLRIVFHVLSITFAITSLCFVAPVFDYSFSNYVCAPGFVWSYAVFDSIIRVSNYVLLNPGLQRARPLRSGASDKLIMLVFSAERKFMLLSQSCMIPYQFSCLDLSLV